MYAREAAQQTADEPLYARRGARGGLAVVRPGYVAARGGSRFPEHSPQETPAAFTRVRDGSWPRAHLLCAAAFLLLEAIADDAPSDLDAAAPALERLVCDLAGLIGEVKGTAPASGGPAWSGERLTACETRVLRYLPTHLGAPEIAAQLYLSPNTVKTHQRHLYRKLGVHSRQEAVQRARAVGLLAGSSGRP